MKVFKLIISLVSLFNFLCYGDDLCPKLTDTQVHYLFSRWKLALSTLKPSDVVDEYWDRSILLPTLSKINRTDRTGKLNYFTEFLKKKPIAHVYEDYIFNDCHASQYRY